MELHVAENENGFAFCAGLECMMAGVKELRVFADGADGFAELDNSPLTRAVTALAAEAGPTEGQSFTLPAMLQLLRLEDIRRIARAAISSRNRAQIGLLCERCCAGSAALTEMKNIEAALGTILKVAVGEALVEEQKPVRYNTNLFVFGSSSLSLFFLNQTLNPCRSWSSCWT